MKKIVFILKPDGTVEVEGVGFSGPECTKFIEAYTKALGGETKEKKKKPEYYRENLSTSSGSA